MQSEYLDGARFRGALAQAVRDLRANRKDINRINVFPVPDGDTGNNMLATLESAEQAVTRSAAESLAEMAAVAHQGAREGSTGNSGAILSQYLKGWADGFAGVERAGAAEMARALDLGSRYAYQSVSDPREGTILTVSRAAATAAGAIGRDGGLPETLQAAYREARSALTRSGRLLPELASRKVVDAGGWGLLILLSAVLRAMEIPIGKAEFHFRPPDDLFGGDRKFQFLHPYDMEFVVRGPGRVEHRVRERIESLGVDRIIQNDGRDCHVHIHTADPLRVVERAAETAAMTDLIVRDMRSQHSALLHQRATPQKYDTVVLGRYPGFVAMYAMAGAHLAATANMHPKKQRMLREYAGPDVLVLCAEGATPSLPRNPVVPGNEIRVLAALVGAYTPEIPTEKAVREVASHVRTGRVTGALAGIANAVGELAPVPGELLTLYYGHPGMRGEIEGIRASLQREFPFLEAIELYFGGHEDPVWISLE